MYQHTGEEYFDSKEFQQLLGKYEDALAAGEPVFMDSEELADIADYYQMTGQQDSADKAIALALELAPGSLAPLTYKIHEALYNGDIGEAEQLLEQIVDKQSPEFIYDKGEILLAKGLVDQAEDLFTSSMVLYQDDELQDFIIDVAGIYQDFNYADIAMRWMKMAKQEDTADYKELMARALFGVGKYKDSERIFNELIDVNPFSKRYWNALASAQFMNEEYSQSVQSSEYAIAIDPKDPESLISKANALYRLDNYEQALEYYRRYSAITPDDEFSLLHQGTCLVNLERHHEAVDILQKAIEAAPEDSPYLPDIYQELAFANSELGNYDKALEWIDRTEQLDCDHIQALVIKGHVMLTAGKIRQAEACFRKAVIESDNPNLTLLRIIVSLYDNKYVEASYALFKKYFRVVPEGHTDGYAYMALCCYDLKKYDEFLYYLKQACKLNPKECKLVLAHLFPDNVEPQDYYNYIKERMKK